MANQPTGIHDPHLRSLLFAYGKRISELEDAVRSAGRQEPPRKNTAADRFQQFHHTVSDALAVSSPTTLGGGALNTVIHVNCTSATTLDLPAARAGHWIIVVNVGTANLTVRNDSSVAICVLTTDDMVVLRSWWNTSDTPEWPTIAPVIAQSGAMIISDTATARDGAAVLHLASTSKGLLLPKMTTTQRDSILSTPVGLVIFNTTNDQPEVYVDNGGSPRWENFSGVAA